MPASLSNGVITISGTEPNPSVLSGVAGVTTETQGTGSRIRTIFTIPAGTIIVVSGTLTHDTDQYLIRFLDNISGNTSPPRFRVTGTYNLGIKSNGRPSSLTGIEISADPVPWFAAQFDGGTSFVVTGVLNWYGGVIAGAISFWLEGSGTIQGGTAVVRDDGITDGTNWLTRLRAPNMSISKYSMIGGSLSIGSGMQGRTISVSRPIGGGVAFWIQTESTTPVRLKDYEVASSYDVGVALGSYSVACVPSISENSAAGTAVDVRGGETAPASGSMSNAGYHAFVRKIATNITMDSGEVSGLVYIKDTNNGQRKNLNSIDDTQDKVYIGTLTNGALSAWSKTGGGGLTYTTDYEVILGIVNVVKAATNTRGTSNVGIYRKDLRGKTDIEGADLFDMVVLGYGFESKIITRSLAGAGVLTVADKVFADANVTLTEAAAGALTTIGSADQLYDAAKHWETRPIAERLALYFGQRIMQTSGSLLDFGAKTLIINSAAGSAFAVNTGTNTVTVKASTLAAGAKFKTVAATAIQVAASTTVSAALAGTVRNAGTITGSVTGDLTNTGTISGSVNGNLIYLSQGAGANLFRYSEQQENAAWLKTRCSITANAAIGPNGKMTAEKLVEDTSNNSHYSYQQVSVTSGVTYTMSCYAKASERSILVMQFHGSNSAFSSSWVFFNLLTGTTSIGSGSPTVQMQYVGDGWYRCAITSVATATAFANIQSFGIATSTPSSSYQGDGASGIFITGAQLEASSAVGPYIPTQANAVTLSGQGSLVGTATGDVIYSNGLANTQTLVATTSIMNLPKSGAISTAGSINFGTSTRILPTGNLTASNTAFAGTLTIETATAIDLTLTNCSGQVNLTVTGNGSVRVILGGSTPRTILPTTLPSGVTVAVACSVVDSTGASFNIVARYGTTGAYTDLGYQTNVTSASYLVAYGSPVELCMWRLGNLSYVRTVQTTTGGFTLDAEMQAEPDVDLTLDVSAYLANITVSNAGGTFTATFESDANIVGIEPTKAIVHRLLGLESAMRALLPPGVASLLEIEDDEIQINQPAVFLRLGSGAVDVAISGFINTAPALAIDPTYRINPRRLADNLRVEIPLVKPEIDSAQIAFAVQTQLAADLARIKAIKDKTDTLVNGPTLAQIEGSTVLAKQATVTALSTVNQAEHDFTQAAIAAIPLPS